MLTLVKEQLARYLAPLTGLNINDIINLLEIPKQFQFGDLALPLFGLAKTMRKAPAVIGGELVATIKASRPSFIEDVTPVGGFLNFRLNDFYLQDILMKAIHDQGERLGFSTIGNGKHIVIDYSSPNVAKPMSIGHLRATVIGQAIRNLAQTQGYKVTGINHLGDWGVQFGKLAWAYEHWQHEYPFAEKPFDSLYKLYVRFHEEAEKDPALEKQGAAYFKRLEEGDTSIKAIWQMCVDLSLQEYGRLWNMLGVKHDLVCGESFFNDRLEAVVERLEQAKLLEESDGAQVVFLDDDMPPCLIRKSDGASLYATRDLAAAIYRAEELKADLNLYVVGADQSLHFKQVFAVLKKLGYSWAAGCIHVAFGLYRFKDIGKMSTRKGNVIFLEDVLVRAVDLVRGIIEQKNPTLKNKELIAEQVGVGAVIFNDLLNERTRNVEFDWDKVVDFEGDSGPYLQYSQVRCRSILQKYGQTIPATMKVALNSPEERFLINLLLRYNEILHVSFRQFKPNVLAQYLLEVCRAFGHFYHSHRVLGEQVEVESARIALVFATQRVLTSGLKVLNIAAPEAM